jgi:hypothetical protein
LSAPRQEVVRDLSWQRVAGTKPEQRWPSRSLGA